MESKFWRPAGVWKTVKGMRTWCNNNCIRCNVACHGKSSLGTCRETTKHYTSRIPSPVKKTSTKCSLTSDRKPMEAHHWKPKGVWNTVKGMSSWCNLNCVRCNIACTGNGNC